MGWAFASRVRVRLCRKPERLVVRHLDNAIFRSKVEHEASTKWWHCWMLEWFYLKPSL